MSASHARSRQRDWPDRPTAGLPEKRSGHRHRPRRVHDVIQKEHRAIGHSPDDCKNTIKVAALVEPVLLPFLGLIILYLDYCWHERETESVRKAVGEVRY